MNNLSGTITFNVTVNIVGSGINTYCVDDNGFINDPDVLLNEVGEAYKDGYVEIIGVDTDDNGYNGNQYYVTNSNDIDYEDED